LLENNNKKIDKNNKSICNLLKKINQQQILSTIRLIENFLFV